MRHRAFSTYPLFETPVRWDFYCLTNSDYVEELVFTIGDDPFDLTGHSFQSQIRVAPNASSSIKTLNNVGSASLEGWCLIDAAGGLLQIRIDRESILSMYQSVYPSTMDGDCVSLPYDLLVTVPGGDKEAWLCGYFNISKGVTNG